MSTRCRAIVVDEQTVSESYFVYIEDARGRQWGGQLRFNQRRVAERLAKAINAGLRTEKRLYVP